MPELFDMKLRALRRDRAARRGPELFLFERVFADCLERIALIGRPFERALLIGCPDPGWPERLAGVADEVVATDPAPLLARNGTIREDAWEPPADSFDLVLAIGSLDTVNDLPRALRLVRIGMRSDGLFTGALSGGDTLPRLRAAMRAADAVVGSAAPHVHPRIEASAIAPLLESAGFVRPVVDIDRVQVSYPSLDRLVADLRSMGATNILSERAPPLTRIQLEEAKRAFAHAGENGRTTETFEILHFATWTASEG